MLALLALLALSAAIAVPFDRRLALWLKPRELEPIPRAFRYVTDWAKALWWLVGLIAIWAGGWAGAALLPAWAVPLTNLSEQAFAVLMGLLAGAAVLHALKFLVGRTRPRDLFRTGAYRFVFFAFDIRLDSFPSGHAQTICGVMTALSLMYPAGAPVFAALAVLLAASRFVATAHYLSDVLIGSAIGAGAAYAVMAFGFPHLIA